MLLRFVLNERRIPCSTCLALKRTITSSQVTSILRPFYFLVHPDLFTQHPRARQINDTSLKMLNNHMDRLINKVKTEPVTLQFYIRNKSEQDILNVKSVDLNKKSPKQTLEKVLQTFDLPTKYIDRLENKSKEKGDSLWNISFDDTILRADDDDWMNFTPKKTLYSWLVSNMGQAEKRLSYSEPIRKDILRLKEQIIGEMKLSKLTYERGIGTTHLRSCMQCLLSLPSNHSELKNIVVGRHIHFGHQTGISMEGAVILSISEVRDQWLQPFMKLDEYSAMIDRIPYMQMALSNSLKNIQVVNRKYQPFFLANNYSQNLKRLVTNLGDYRGKCGLPESWPESLEHLQLVVESANGPLMLSPTGQIIAPASCPPWLLTKFITDNKKEAFNRIREYESIKSPLKELHRKCKLSLGLEFFDSDDSISPQNMMKCLESLLKDSYRLSPLLSGAHVWVTHYYSVLLDGEVCIPWDWVCDA